MTFANAVVRDERTVVRIEHVDCAAVDGINKATVDEKLGLHESSSGYCWLAT